MRPQLSAAVAILALLTGPNLAFSADQPPPVLPSYEPMAFPQGEPGDLERGLLDAFFSICSRNASGPCAGNQKQDFDREAAEARSDSSKVPAFTQRWRRLAAKSAQRFHQLLQQPLANPNAATIDAHPDSPGMVTTEEDHVTTFVAWRKPPEKRKEIGDLIDQGNTALAAIGLHGGPAIVAAKINKINRDKGLHVPDVPPDEDAIRKYIVGQVLDARQKSDQGVIAYLGLPEVQQALGQGAPTATVPGPVMPDVQSNLDRLRQEAENDEQCKKITDPQAQRDCIDAAFETRRQAAGLPPVVVPPPGQTQPGHMPGLQPAPQGLPTDDGGLRFDVPPPASISSPPPSKTGLILGQLGPYIGPVVGAIGGALLGAFLLAPLIGVGWLAGALIGAAALGVAGYFIGKQIFGSSNN